MHPVVAARGLTKRFPGVVALRGVDFDLRAGEIHALCGENGAGKSTLIKLLSGIHPHGTYEGELRIDGRPAAFRSVRDAEAAGLAVITQELALVDGLSVAENLVLGRAPRRGWRIDWPTLHRRATDLLREFGLNVDPEMPVGRLGIGQKQLVEIARAMDKRSRVLVLDEPTAALAPREVGVLQEHLRRLRAGGTACIYISHRLEEMRALADRVTVLRDGATVATLDHAEAEPALIIRQMVGRELTEQFPRPAAAVERRGEPLLVVEELRVAPPPGSRVRLEEVSLTVHPGEVLGIGGLMGAGRTELLLHLFAGWGRRLAGEVHLRGRPYTDPAGPVDCARNGAGDGRPPTAGPDPGRGHHVQPVPREPESFHPARRPAGPAGGAAGGGGPIPVAAHPGPGAGDAGARVIGRQPAEGGAGQGPADRAGGGVPRRAHAGH
jgi:D-xylose transport system ATP-binding protein